MAKLRTETIVMGDVVDQRHLASQSQLLLAKPGLMVGS